jgi:hypothetical protein
MCILTNPIISLSVIGRNATRARPTSRWDWLTLYE